MAHRRSQGRAAGIACTAAVAVLLGLLGPAAQADQPIQTPAPTPAAAAPAVSAPTVPEPEATDPGTVEGPSEEPVDPEDLPVDPELTAFELLAEQIGDEVAAAALHGTQTATDAIVIDQGAFNVAIPQNAESGDIKVGIGTADPIRISMPTELVTALAPTIIEGEAVYGDPSLGTVSSVGAMEDRSVQIKFAIPTGEAPMSYTFDLGLSEKQLAEMNPDGSISIFELTDSGFFQPTYAFNAPWAKDANGQGPCDCRCPHPR